MRRPAALLAALPLLPLLPLLLLLPARARADEGPDAAAPRALPVPVDTGLLPLWEARPPKSKKKTPSLWLLGSIHAGKPEIYPLDPAIEAAFARSQTLVVEADIVGKPPEAMAAEMGALATFTDGRTLDSVLPAASWELVRGALLPLGVPEEALRMMKPWAAHAVVLATMLPGLGWDPDLGIDRYFLERREGRRVLELEGLVEQLRILDRLPIPAQLLLLDPAEMQPERAGQVIELLVRCWRLGDGAALDSLSNHWRDGDDAGRALYRGIVADRNAAWAAVLADRVKEKRETFVVVGALHLVGPDGLPELLRARGFSVRQVPRTPPPPPQ